VLTEHRDRLVHISERLIQRETLEGAEFEELFTADLPAGAPYPTAHLPADAAVDVSAVPAEGGRSAGA